MIQQISCTYRNIPIPGGGYVTGFALHPGQPDLLYARTDIGGTYRFDCAARRWVSLSDHVTAQDPAEAFPAALALDPRDPQLLYIVSGADGTPEGRLSVSRDRGESFQHFPMPMPVHGNWSGRGTGARLVVSSADSRVLYYASQLSGLWRTENGGGSWQKLPLPEDYTTFIWVSPDEGILVAGTAGYTSRPDDRHRGHSLYVSYDRGNSWEKLTMPENVEIPDSKMNNLVASRYDFDGTYLYVTMNCTGRWNYIVPLGYSCDTGDVIGGRVVRYFFRDGRIAGFDDITPEGGQWCNYGFGGISSCPARPGLLVCSTLCREKDHPETIYLSEDHGSHWRISLDGLEVGGLRFRAPYMKPCYNGGVSLLHWISDVKLDPFDPNRLWFNSGTGVFAADRLLSQEPGYHDLCDGLEETVHLNVYAPLSGAVQVVDILGDLGGFAFRQLDRPCENSFADDRGNRYITCINAALSDQNSDLAVIAARGNWKGSTKGGLIRTEDGFRTFRRLTMPFSLGGALERQLRLIEQPNVNPGWVAMSADGQNLVWSVADNIRLPMEFVIFSRDGGNSFRRVRILDRDGGVVTGGCFKAFADPVLSLRFYGFDDRGRVYRSDDGGETFCLLDTTLPAADFGLIDTANETEVRPAAGESGLFYLALGKHGLWKLHDRPGDDRVTCRLLTAAGESCMHVGLGLGKPGGDYLHGCRALYVSGVIGGAYGFYRTTDEGKSWQRLNTERQMFGLINSMDGDKRVYGRFYIGTGTRGLIYGETEE